ncbi:hypothetical protein CMI37_09385 [Candidatus Pacearchaeota archaeon]|nr:hypothetical protein [Candidatus Pacearchaeota archaeon]|tara:strand:+ start:1192 stop:1392 length:201 start_codon:yes stop_codon:yes gene_type:complete
MDKSIEWLIILVGIPFYLTLRMILFEMFNIARETVSYGILGWYGLELVTTLPLVGLLFWLKFYDGD